MAKTSWVENHKLSDLNLWAGDKIFMSWLHKKQFFSAKFIYHQGIFKDYQVVFY